ncbi:ATP-binding protein [Candidatus Microgenomates bacterium]|nr:ATP-binding protein [Candidatus Microgenomates bacterium]
MREPKLYILCGLPFAGKTTLANEIVKLLGFMSVNIDEIKVEKGYKDVGDDDISDDVWKDIFEEIQKRIGENLDKGKSIICESYNVVRSARNETRVAALRRGIETVVIFVNIPEEVTRKRWLENKQTNERFDISERVYNEAKREFEPPTENENVIIYNGTIPINEWIEQLK